MYKYYLGISLKRKEEIRWLYTWIPAAGFPQLVKISVLGSHGEGNRAVQGYSDPRIVR